MVWNMLMKREARLKYKMVNIQFVSQNRDFSKSASSTLKESSKLSEL